MTRRGPRPRRAWLVLAALVVLGGCTYFPTVLDVGGVRLQPEKGRLVRQGDGASFYLRINSIGKYGDTLAGAEVPVARKAELVTPSGERVGTLEIPGETIYVLSERGPRVVFSEFTRPLNAGEVVIVTLHFIKSGALGIVSVVE